MSIYHIHHIVPRHMGGTDDPSNLIELTVEEHADAHLRLWEEHGSKYDLIAYQCLSGSIDKKDIIRQVQTESAKKRWSDPEYRKRHSEAMKQRWLDPEYREKQNKRSFYKNPEYRERISKANIKRWSDPEYRKRCGNISKTRAMDPEYRKRCGEAIKKGKAAAKAKKSSS